MPPAPSPTRSRTPTAPVRGPTERPRAGAAPRAGSPTRGHRRWSALDGMRGLAVVAVVGYHLAPDRLPGGFLGVDMFFVLSGFLITTGLIDEERRLGYVRIIAFWRRRVRRLWAPMVAMLVGATALAGLALGSGASGLRQQWIAAWLWVSNWQQIQTDTPYFDSIDPPLFQHLWSLAIEEQFYLVWPLLLMVTYRWWRLRGVRVVAVMLAVGSAIAMAWHQLGGDPARAYLGTDSHAFGLFIGVIVAVAVASDHRRPRRPTWRRRVATWVVLALLVAAMTRMDGAAAYPYLGGILLFSCGVGLVVHRLTGAPGALSRVLSTSVLTWTGRRSYAIYLWHWPLLVIARDALPGASAWVRGAAVVAVTLVLAEASWWVLERPIIRIGLRAYAHRVWRAAVRTSTPRGRVTARTATITLAVTSVAAGLALMVSPSQGVAVQRIRLGEAMLAGTAHPAASTPRSTSRAGPSTRSTSPHPAPSSSATASGAGSPASVGTPSAAPGPRATTRAVSSPAAIRVSGRGVTAIGDSVMLASVPELLDTFPGIRVDAHVGAQMRDLPGLLDTLDRRGLLRSTVVIGLGTNGDFVEAQVAAALARHGHGRRFYLMTAHANRSWTPSVNRKLRDLADHGANVHLVDWNAAAGSVRDFAPDGIHPGPQGGGVYAQLLAAAVARG